MKKFQFAPKKVYDQFVKYFPFSTVDIIIFDDDSFVLTKRAISPYRGLWHLPGTIVRRGEKINNAAKRVAKTELNLDIKLEKFLGVYENRIRTRHDITHCFIANACRGKINKDYQGKAVKFFKRPPFNTIPYHKTMIKDAIAMKKLK